MCISFFTPVILHCKMCYRRKIQDEACTDKYVFSNKYIFMVYGSPTHRRSYSTGDTYESVLCIENIKNNSRMEHSIV